MALNVELAERVREQIVMNPESHDQDSWGYQADCGTVCCIAGWAVELAGEMVWKTDLDGDGVTVLGFLASGRVAIPDRAQELLGLTQDEADTLFAPRSEWRAKGKAADEKAVEYLEELIKDARNQVAGGAG